ncbi:MAG: hypothetical protein ACRBCT_02595 [Alphaproteobacteria bacterium]
MKFKSTILPIIVLFQMFTINYVFAGTSCTNTTNCRSTTNAETNQSRDEINAHTNDEFAAHRVWWISIVWEDNILPALMLMSEQLTAVGMKQVEVIGTFIDAKHQMETQQTFGELRARAHKDYHPSVGMCEFGSSIKSLAASERIGEMNSTIMAQRSMDRMLGNANTSGAGEDTKSRLKQFREVYCDISDNNNGLALMCDHDNAPGGNSGGADPLRFNKDIDITRTLDAPWSLDVNFTDGGSASTPDEQDVLALAANLYGSEVLYRPGIELKPLDDLANTPNIDESKIVTPAQTAYLDARAVMAKRSVAENSFNAIVGEKSSGTVGSRQFLEALLKELGMEDTGSNVKTSNGNKSELDALLGDNPSYYAQMEVLTKKLYQNPDFYTNLYDKPANVERKGVALQAIGLMQKFDLFKSYLRNEATMSILLELAVADIQEEIETEMGDIDPQAEKRDD